MTTSNQAAPLDFSYRPETYWESDDPCEVILSDIKGEQRRHLVRQALESGDVGNIPESILGSQLEEPERRDWGKIHPLYMGGEYLAGDLPGETAIARVSLNSTTGDVSELRACPVRDGIGYRIVDEYETRNTLPFNWSRRPLATWQVVRLLDEVHGLCIHMGTGIVMAPVAMNYGRGPAKREEIADWRRKACMFARVQSRFYPGLDDWYARRIENWADAVVEARGWKPADEDGDPEAGDGR